MKFDEFVFRCVLKMFGVLVTNAWSFTPTVVRKFSNDLMFGVFKKM